MLRPALLLAALLTGSAAAQGGIRWIDPAAPCTLHVRELANGDWQLAFDGWSTTDGVPFFGDQQAAGVGVDSGARTNRSTSSDFLREDKGGEATAMVLFPFAPDNAVVPVFRPAAPLLDWYGFTATPGGPVPSHSIGVLTFRVVPAQPLPLSVMLPLLANSRAGVAMVDLAGNATGSVFDVRPNRTRPARICYFDFDRGEGAEAVNYAGAAGGALTTGKMIASVGSAWVPGRNGHALRGHCACDAGWTGDLGSRFTVAWTMREASPPPASASPLFGLAGFGVYTGGTAGTGLECGGWGGLPATLRLPVNVQALARGNWVHVALVVDGDAARATWYVGGTARANIALGARARIPSAATTLRIGSSASVDSVYDIDEFVLVAEAVDPATVAAWAAGSLPGRTPFSATCGASLRTDDVPRPGGTVHMRVEAPAGSVAKLFLGPTTKLRGVVPLPLDLGFLDPGLAGCAWYCDLALDLPALMVPAGDLLVAPLRLPPDPALSTLELYAQALVVDATGLRATNALALSIE